jgi:hypothetical protein
LGVGLLTGPAWAQAPLDPGTGSGQINEPGLSHDLATLDYEIVPHGDPAPESFIGNPALQLFASQYQASGRPALASLPAFPSNDLIAVSDNPSSTGNFLHLISQPGRFNASYMLRSDVVHALSLPKMGIGDRDALFVRITDGSALVLLYAPETNGHTVVNSSTPGYTELANWGNMSLTWVDSTGNLLGFNGTDIRRVTMTTSFEPGGSGDAFTGLVSKQVTGIIAGAVQRAAAIQWDPASAEDEIALLVEHLGERFVHIVSLNSINNNVSLVASLPIGHSNTPACMAVSRGTPGQPGDLGRDCLAAGGGIYIGPTFTPYCISWMNASTGQAAQILWTTSKVAALTSHNTAASDTPPTNDNDLLLALEQDQRILALKRFPTSFWANAQAYYYQLASGFQANLLSGGDMDGDGDFDLMAGITGAPRYATILLRQRPIRQQFRATTNTTGQSVPVEVVTLTNANNDQYNRVTMRLNRHLPTNVGLGTDLANAAQKIQVELFTHKNLTGTNAATEPSDAARLASTITSLVPGQTYFDVVLTYLKTAHPANDIYYVCMRYLDTNNLPVGPALTALYVPTHRESEFAGPINVNWPEINVDQDGLDGDSGGVTAGELTPLTKKRPPPIRQTPNPVTHSEQKAPGT